MVDKNQTISVYVSFYTVSKIIIYPTRLEAEMPAALNFLSGNVSMDQLIVNHQ